MRSLDEPDPESRVKIYFLGDDGQWADRGTGHVHIVPDDAEYLLMTTSENAREKDGHPKVVLTTKVSLDDIYQQQQGHRRGVGFRAVQHAALC